MHHDVDADDCTEIHVRLLLGLSARINTLHHGTQFLVSENAVFARSV